MVPELFAGFLFFSSGQNWRLRCIPYFHVIGMQKSGTTALSVFIKKFLPEYAEGLIKEPHFWDFKRYLKNEKCGKKLIWPHIIPLVSSYLLLNKCMCVCVCVCV